MTRRFAGWIIALLTLPPGLAVAQGQDTEVVPDHPELSVRLIPPEPYLQEQIIQTVRVVSAHIFEELDLDLPPVEGAEIITLQKPKTRPFKTYGGEGFIYETRRAIFPKASGDLVIPPVRVSGAVAIGGDERRRFDLSSEPVALDIKPPPETFTGSAWVVARRVEIKEHWSQPLEELRLGDHVTRRVEAAAYGVTGAHLPELEHGRSTGLTILPGRTERSTEITDDEVIGRISRSFELRVDVEQPINISPVRLVWWNTDTEIEWRSAAQATRLEPLPRDADGLVQTLMAEAEAAQRAGRYGLVATAAIAGLALALASILFLRAKRRRAPEDQRLLDAVQARRGAIEATGALLTWGETCFPEDRPMSLDRLKQHLGGDAKLELTALQAAAFGPAGGDVDTIHIARTAIAAARRRRGSSMAAIISKATQYLLGPEKRLPRIGGD